MKRCDWLFIIFWSVYLGFFAWGAWKFWHLYWD